MLFAVVENPLRGDRTNARKGVELLEVAVLSRILAGTVASGATGEPGASSCPLESLLDGTTIWTPSDTGEARLTSSSQARRVGPAGLAYGVVDATPLG